MENLLSTTLRNISWFKQTDAVGQLIMKPPFQRNIVWLNNQKSYLIDSILKGYPIPEIYMQESVNEEGITTYIIVDGQQRINSILEFLKGNFKLDEEMCPQWPSLGFDDLTSEQKKKFYQYNFVVRLLPEIEDNELREIFQRLNRNVVSLNDQELRQAVYCGPFIKAMNDISNYVEFNRIRLFTANDIRRMLDVEFVSELTIAYLNGVQNKKNTLESYYQMYEMRFEEDEHVRSMFRKVLEEILVIMPDIAKTRWRKKTDFYSLFLVFAEHQDFLPLSCNKRLEAGEILNSFGSDVTTLLKNIGEGTPVDSNEKLYAASVRASSDLGCRRNRARALNNILTNIW